jgi:hypothetical protein
MHYGGPNSALPTAGEQPIEVMVDARNVME